MTGASLRQIIRLACLYVCHQARLVLLYLLNCCPPWRLLYISWCGQSYSVVDVVGGTTRNNVITTRHNVIELRDMCVVQQDSIMSGYLIALRVMCVAQHEIILSAGILLRRACKQSRMIRQQVVVYKIM